MVFRLGSLGIFVFTLALVTSLAGSASATPGCIEFAVDDGLLARGIALPPCPNDQDVIPNVFRPENPLFNVLQNIGSGGDGGTTASTEDGLPDVASPTQSRFRTWVEFVHNSAENDSTNSRYDARAINLVSGLEYTLPSGTVLAASFAREDLDLDAAAALGGNFDGRGFTFAPYVVMSFMESWKVSVMGGWSWLDFDYRGTRDDPDGQRLFASFGVLGNFEVGDGIRLSPTAFGWYAEQASDTYFNAIGTRISGTRSDFGRISAGAELGYPVELSIGRIEPFLRLLAEADFDDDDRQTLSNGTTFSRDDFGFVAGGGLNASLSKALDARMEATWDSIGRDDLDAFTVRGKFEYRF